MGLFQQFIKSFQKNHKIIIYLKNKFKLTDKASNGILTGPQIKQLINDKDNFMKNFNNLRQKSAFLNFIELTNNFLGNYRADNYEKLINKFINSYKKLNVNISPKLHYIISRLDKFPVN